MHQTPLFPEWLPGDEVPDAEQLEELRAFDELAAVTGRYRSSPAFGRLLDFVIRMRELSPYNAALLYLQKPEARHVRSAAEWHALGRSVHPGAAPALLLHPGGPVRFVFDVAETEGLRADPPPDPPPVSPQELLRATVEHVRRLGVAVTGPLFGPEPAGRLRRGEEGAAFVLTLEEGDAGAQYAVLVYELARYLLGHLGPCEACSGEARPPADDISGRFEAGAVAAVVCGRAGVPTEDGAFVRGYLQNFAEVPEISLDRILAVAGRIERLGRPARG